MKFKVGNKVRYLDRECVVVECIDEELKEGNKNVYIITDGNRFTTHANENELEYIKPTINDLRDYMLEHFVDYDGNLDICGLDFSDFEGNVYITELKCSGDLSQSCHEVKGDLYQSSHEVGGDLIQTYINVKQDYNCYNIKYGGNIHIDEPQKILKEITKEELAEMGYKLKGVK